MKKPQLLKFGLFHTHVVQALHQKKIRPVDVVKKTDGKIDAPMMSLITKGAAIPMDADAVDMLASALDINPHKLRICAAADRTEMLCDNYGVKMSDICKQTKSPSNNFIPLYDSDELPMVLSPMGSPIRQSRFVVESHKRSGKYFAVRMKGQALYPKVEPGDICVVAVGKKVINDKIGLIGLKNKVLLGQVKVHGALLSVMNLVPFDTTTFKKKLVLYAFPITGVLSEADVEIRQVR